MSQKPKCSICGEEAQYDQLPFVDTENGNAPVCRECYEEWRDDQPRQEKR